MKQTNPPNKTDGRRVLHRHKTISIVVPCYNEEDVLNLLFDRLSDAAEDWQAAVEFILVDDGSTDRTWEIIQDFNLRDSRWKAVRLARNMGHQTALWTGLRHASGDVIGVLDADLQDPPEVLPRMFAKWEQGNDVVYGVRRKRKESPFRRLAYFAFYRLMSVVAEINIPLDSGDFCVMDRRVLEAMLRSKEINPYVRGIRAWVGYSQVGLAYERDARAAGAAKYTLRKLIELATSGIFGFSTRPLRVASYLGIAVTSLSTLGGILMAVQWMLAGRLDFVDIAAPSPLAALALALALLGGVQLICMGILGEYVGRIYDNVKGRPLSIVRETLGLNAQQRERENDGDRRKAA